MTEELGTTQDIINARITLATGRGMVRGEAAAAIAALEASAAEALAAHSHLAARAYINIGTFSIWVGDLSRAAAAHRAGLEVARRFTSQQWERWLATAIAQDDFYAGEWAAAHEASSAITSLPGGQSYLDLALLQQEAVMADARGEDAAELRVAALVAQARAIGDPRPSIRPWRWRRGSQQPAAISRRQARTSRRRLARSSPPAQIFRLRLRKPPSPRMRLGRRRC